MLSENEALLRAAIAFLEAKHDPMDVMVNHVLEVSMGQTPVLYSLPVRKNGIHAPYQRVVKIDRLSR